MSTFEPIAAARLEELLAGAVPEGAREAQFQGVVRQLRVDAAPAPASLRARVREIGTESASRRARLVPRRSAVAFAILVVLFAAAAGAVALRGAEEKAVVSADSGLADGNPTRSPAMEVPRTVGGAQAAAPETYLRAPTSTADRATDVDLWVELRVADADGVSDAARDAVAITRDLGGWVSASDVDTAGREGSARLVLRVPVGRVEDAVTRLSALGTITGQRVETEDLQAGIDRRGVRIEQLEREIGVAELRLASGTLDAGQRLRVEIRLERLRAAADDLRRANLRDQREAAISELTLVLHTREAPVATGHEGGVAGTARDAVGFLGRAGGVALFLAIVLSPLLPLALLLWLALRARGRRVERRLLEPPDPTAPSTGPPA
jgi:hypothetical protein